MSKIVDRISKVINIYDGESTLTFLKPYSEEFMDNLLCIYEDAFGLYNAYAFTKEKVLEKFKNGFTDETRKQLDEVYADLQRKLD